MLFGLCMEGGGGKRKGRGKEGGGGEGGWGGRRTKADNPLQIVYHGQNMQITGVY